MSDTMNVTAEEVFGVTMIPAIQTATSRFNARDGKAARPSFTWEYAGFNADNSHDKPFAQAINSAIEAYGKRLIVKNASDWSYSPTPATCNLETLIADLEAERAGWTRVVTKESLAACASYYKEAAVRILGKTSAAAEAGAILIREKLASAAGNPDTARVFSGNLIAILEGESEPEKLSPHVEVIQRLLQMLAEYSQSKAVDPSAL